MNAGEKANYFDADALRKMEKFEKDFLSNQYKKDTSENKGPNYKDKIAVDDSKAFFEYLDSDFSKDFLNLE